MLVLFTRGDSIKTIVINGGTNNIGKYLGKAFRKNNYNVIICDEKKDLEATQKFIAKEKGNGKIMTKPITLNNAKDIEDVIKQTTKIFTKIDIWINCLDYKNYNNSFDMSFNELENIININLTNTILATNFAIKHMKTQASGAIYNLEGSNYSKEHIFNTSLTKTLKKAVRIYSENISKELITEKSNVIIGTFSPGIIIPDYNLEKLSDENKILINSLGDNPEAISEFLYENMTNNTRNGIRIVWLNEIKMLIKLMKYKLNSSKKKGEVNE